MLRGSTTCRLASGMVHFTCAVLASRHTLLLCNESNTSESLLLASAPIYGTRLSMRNGTILADGWYLCRMKELDDELPERSFDNFRYYLDSTRQLSLYCSPARQIQGRTQTLPTAILRTHCTIIRIEDFDTIDNFRFVNFTELAEKAKRQKFDAAKWEAAFAHQALMEIPEQYIKIKEMRLLGRCPDQLPPGADMVRVFDPPA